MKLGIGRRSFVLGTFLGLSMALGALTGGIMIGTSGCTPTEKAVGRGVVKAVDAQCVEIEGEVSGTSQTICATAHELAPIVEMLLARRAQVHAASAPCQGSAAPPAATGSSSAPAAKLPMTATPPH